MKTFFSIALCALLVSASLAAEQPASGKPAEKPTDKLEKKTAPVYVKNAQKRDGAHHHHDHHEHAAPAAPGYGAAPPAPSYAAAPAAPAPYAAPAPAAYAPQAPAPYAAPAPAAYSAPAPASYSAQPQSSYAAAPATYSAPAPAYSAPAPAYQAAPAYEQPAAPAYAPAAPSSYEAPAASYEQPAAPAYTAPANQGYYYYYYPVKAGKGKAALPKLPKANLKGMWEGVKSHASDLYHSLPSLPSFGNTAAAYAKTGTEEDTLLGLGITSIVLLIVSFALLVAVPLIDPNNFGNFNLFKPINLAGIGLPNLTINKPNLQGLLGRSASFHFADYFNNDALNTFAGYVLNALDELESQQPKSQ